MLLNSHILAYATCFARKVCGLVRPIWGTSLGEDKLGARDRILNTKVARRACAGCAPGKHSPKERGDKKRWPHSGVVPSSTPLCTASCTPWALEEGEEGRPD